jgi:hypothetical protein
MWPRCNGSGLLACDNEMLAGYLMFGGMVELLKVQFPAFSAIFQALQAVVVRRLQAEIRLQSANTRMSSQ